MNNIENIIEKLGFSDKQVKVYMSALELAEANITDLAKKAGLKRSTVHLAVSELEMMGLLSETKKGKKRMVSAVHPRRLLELASFREKRIEEIMPELVAIYNAPTQKPKIQVFEGIEGVRSLYLDLYKSLNNKEEALWFARISALKAVPESITEWKKMLRLIKNPRIRELNYDDAEGRAWVEDQKKLRGKNHFVKFLPKDFEFGFTDNLIFGNKLVIFSLKKDVFVIVIESEEVVKTYRALFEWAYRQGKNV